MQMTSPILKSADLLGLQLSEWSISQSYMVTFSGYPPQKKKNCFVMWRMVDFKHWKIPSLRKSAITRLSWVFNRITELSDGMMDVKQLPKLGQLLFNEAILSATLFTLLYPQKKRSVLLNHTKAVFPGMLSLKWARVYLKSCPICLSESYWYIFFKHQHPSMGEDNI